jgi:hypothetical protein
MTRLRGHVPAPGSRRAPGVLAAPAENTAEPNIELVKANSLFLPSLKLEPFDLIWVDGSHLYPEVAGRVDDHVTYFMKRYAPIWSADPRRRKYVALLQKG